MKTKGLKASRNKKSNCGKHPIDSFFRLGTIHVDSELVARLRRDGMELTDYLRRHSSGDCGEICDIIKSRNLHVMEKCLSKELAIKRGYLVISRYSLGAGEKFCIATKSLGRGTVAAFDFQLKSKIGKLGSWGRNALNEALGK